MSKKGFSLIELMGVIILLSIISVLVIPSVDRAMRDFKTKSYNSQLQTIRLAANDWSTENLGKYAMDDGQMVTIVLGQLKSGGYLQDKLINTKTNEPFPDDMQINIVRVEDTLKYYVLDTTGSSTGNYEGAPNIALNGEYLQRIPIGGTYTELGAYATSSSGAGITGITTVIKNSSNQTVSSVNTSTAGEYKIFYSVTNNGLTRTIYRTVVVYDFKEFTLLLNGSSTVAQTVGVAYIDAGAIAYDPIDGIISGSIVVNNEVDTSKVGVYFVNYSITNSSGKTIAVKRKVIVSDNMPPVITIIGANPFNMQAGTYTDPGASATDNIDGNVSHLIITNSNVTPMTVGTYSVIYTVIDSGGNTATATRTVVVSDSTFPTVAFGTNGNATWGTSRSTTVTVSDTGTGVNPATLEYQWTTSTTQPTEASFVTAFTNGATITSPAGVSGTYYLWILGKDLAGNTTITNSNVFNLDNSNPTITANNASSSWFTSRTTTITGTDNLGIAEIRYQWNTNGMNAACTTGGTVTTTGTTLTVPAGSNQLFLCIRDNAGNTATYASGANMFRVDDANPTVTFGTNGHATYAKTRSTTVTVADTQSGVNAATLEYLWTTTATAPAEASFVTTFTNGATITTPAGLNGQYYLWILAKDNLARTSIIGSNAFNLDNTNPTITLVGENPFNMYAGTFNDPGATASDTVDGVITNRIVVGGNLTPTIPGTYTVTYTVSDTALNSATVSRTVNVTDSTAPTVTFSVNGHTDWGTTSTTVVTVTDSESGVNASSLKYQWTTSTAAPTEASFTTSFTNGGAISRGTTGTYYLWILAKDIAANTRIINSNVFYIWTAWSSWSTTAISNPPVTKQVETKMQYQYRDWGATGTYQCNPYSCGCSTCYSCNGGCPGTNYYGGRTNPLSFDGRLSGTTCNCEYQHPSYYYTSGSYPASSYSCGCSTCYNTCTSYGWLAWNGTWIDTGSCPAQQAGVRDYTCQTLYRYRDR